MIISSSLLTYFQQVYIINLPERSDRRNEINEQLNLIGLSLEHEKINLFKAIRPQDAGEFESIGARGCFLSHLNVLKHAKSKAYDRILIIEDDLNFSHDFSNKIDKTIEELSQNNWQIFFWNAGLRYR